MPARLLICFFLFLSHSVFGQKTISGFVRDAETNEKLPAANIQIAGTYSGTISNMKGRFNLTLDKLPATLLVRYMGYKSLNLEIREETPTSLDLVLEPVSLKFGEVVVTAEDPAFNIMRKVIAQKKRWRENLNTYSAHAYSRQKLQNDSGIVSIMETISVAYWDKKKGAREIIKSKKQTKNMKAEHNFAAASYVPNLYDDDVEIQGFRLIGPTHPDAIKHYDFKLIGYESFDEKQVYRIRVKGKSKLQPTFIGEVMILDQDYAMLEASLMPDENILYPVPIKSWDLLYKQKFDNFGQDFWLPVDVLIDGRIKIGFTGLDFPAFKYAQLSRLSDYKVNISLPDSLYKLDDMLHVDSVALREKTLEKIESEIVPLAEEERSAYRNIDSSYTLEKAFKPTGFLARYVIVKDGRDRVNKEGQSANILAGVGPQGWFNRVDGGHLGVTHERDFGRHMNLNSMIGYSLNSKKWAFGTTARYYLDTKLDQYVYVGYVRTTTTRTPSVNYGLSRASLSPLFGGTDYFDYYRLKKLDLGIGARISAIDTKIDLAFSLEEHSALTDVTNFDLFGRNNVHRSNPVIDAGTLHALKLSIMIGEDLVPWGIVGQKRLQVDIEHSSDDLLGGDFSFTRYHAMLDWRIPTFLKRRMLPNVFDLRILAGTFSGDLPVQRFGALDVSLQHFSPFGGFKTSFGRPYEGEKYAGLFWEHNFRTVPFEIFGMQAVAKKGIGLIVHGASGRTWLSQNRAADLEFLPKVAHEFHHEIGLAINGVFGVVRLDLTKRLDSPGLYFGLSMARLF